MTRRRPPSDAHDYEHEGLDPEGPSAADLEQFGSEFQPCPRCGAQVYDQAEWCHDCGAIMDRPDKGAGMPKWALVLTGVVLFAFVVLILRL